MNVRRGTTTGAWMRKISTTDVHRVVAEARSFYGEPRNRWALAVMAPVLSYGGGAVMFWFHADFRGERGPAINPWFHWLLDSTLGFVALTPALLCILPAAAWLLAASRRRSMASYGVLVGASFAVVTGPGPIVHNILAGPDGPLGRWAAATFGTDPAVAAHNLNAPMHNPVVEAFLQVLVGLAVYVLLTWLSLFLAFLITAGWTRSTQPRRTAAVAHRLPSRPRHTQGVPTIEGLVIVGSASLLTVPILVMTRHAPRADGLTAAVAVLATILVCSRRAAVGPDWVALRRFGRWTVLPVAELTTMTVKPTEHGGQLALHHAGGSRIALRRAEVAGLLPSLRQVLTPSPAHTASLVGAPSGLCPVMHGDFAAT